MNAFRNEMDCRRWPFLARVRAKPSLMDPFELAYFQSRIDRNIENSLHVNPMAPFLRQSYRNIPDSQQI